MNNRKIIQEIDSRLEKLGNHYHDKKDTDGNRQVVEIFAEAIQAEPVDAVISSWGVTLDAKGNISAVS